MLIRRGWPLVLALAAALALAFAPAAHAKDYHIATIDIRAAVASDGSMQVEEKRDVAFSGEFHWAQWALDKTGSEGIELIGVDGPNGPMQQAQGDISGTPAPGTYLAADEGNRVLIKVGFSASDETLGFTLRYKVLGAAKRYKDTSELYWKFVGSETGVRTDQVHVQVTLPGVRKADVKAWAHGPLNGTVGIVGSEDLPGVVGPMTLVKLDVTDLPPNTFVEGRILFPASALSGAPLIDQPRAAAVQAEEGKLAEEANAKRRQAQALVGLAYLGGIGLPFLILGVVILLWYRFGREYKPVEVQGEYYRDIPEGVSTPLVGALWHFGEPDNATLGATLMDLSLKRAVYMKPVTLQEPGLFGGKAEPTYELTLDRAKIAEADPLERDLTTFVFDDTMSSDTFTMHSLRDTAKAHPQSFTKGLSAWKQAVANKAENDLHWIEAKSRSMQIVSILLAVVAGIAAVVALVATQSAVFAVGLLPAIAAFVLAFQVKRRSREAVELFAKYEGLRNYMRDFGRMQEKPPTAVALWERYLVLAVIFGIADQVIAQLRVAVPEMVNDPAFATAYWWTAPTAYGDRSSPVGSLTSGFGAAVSAANSAMSSSSGGGGGFSGGGGGGGGGGGFSAG